MNRKYDQRGLAHLAAILIVVVLVAVIGFAGWKVASKNKSGSGNSSKSNAVVSDKQVESACNAQLHDKDLCKFASNYNLSNVPYKATITTTGSNGNTLTEMQVDGKNNSSMVTKQGSTETAAFITLNKSSYIKDESSGVWTKYTDNSSAPTESSPTSDIKIDNNNLTENNTISYKALGKEACGKLKCFKYQIVDSQNPGTTQYIWFDDKDYMMQRFYVKDANGTSDMVFTFTSVTIKEPSPVKDFSASTGAPSSADVNAALQAAQDAANSYSADDSAQ